MTEIVVENPQEIIDRLNALVVGYPDDVSNAVWYELSRVMNEAKKLCPVETGYMRGSGYVGEPLVEDGKISVTLGFFAEYAWWVHENLLANHHPPTQAKFLEVPLIDAAPDLMENICNRVTWLIERGIGRAVATRFVREMMRTGK